VGSLQEGESHPFRVAFFFALAIASMGLAGCAFSPAAETPYVGVFTGEFVEGLPLYRFPTIEVVGSRRTVNDESGKPD
jgi:hypothetical protein